MNTPDNMDNPGKASVDSFFNDLDNDVNGIVLDGNQRQETTLRNDVAPPIEDNLQQSNEAPNIDWEKRYKDSSREAVRMRDQLGNMKPFVPILDAMKKDRGLVDHVRGYFENGGKPAETVKISFMTSKKHWITPILILEKYLALMLIGLSSRKWAQYSLQRTLKSRQLLIKKRLNVRWLISLREKV